MTTLPPTWLVYRVGSPDPTRASPAIHFDDPAHDRCRKGHLVVIPIAPQHRGLPLLDLAEMERYRLLGAEGRDCA